MKQVEIENLDLNGEVVKTKNEIPTVIDDLDDGSRVSTLENDVFTLQGKIPNAPDTDGTYVLKCIVLNGEATYEWVEEIIPV